MARIARLLALDEMARAAELRAWLAAQADRLAEQSELVDAIVRRSADSDAGLAGAVRVRDVPAAKLAYLQTHVDIDGLEPFAEHADATLRDALARRPGRRRPADAAFPRSRGP